MPICNIFLTNFLLNLNLRVLLICICKSFLVTKYNITKAATIRDTKVGIATPAVSNLNPKIKIAFPKTFITFIKQDTSIGVLEFICALNIAVPALYTAKNGIEAEHIIKYVFA